MIVVAGEALLDRIVAADGANRTMPGGGPFNTARTIARLGVPVAFLGCLSTDAAGADLRHALESDGVDVSMVMTTDAPTTVAEAHLDAQGGVTYSFDTAGSSAPLLDGRWVRAMLATPPEALHVGGLGLVLEPMATALAAGAVAMPGSTLVMVDPNCRPTAITDRDSHSRRLDRVLRRADVVKASRDDLDYLWPGISVSATIDQLLGAGVRLVLVTDGAAPVACHGRAFALELPVPEVAIEDTVGAGDAFGGAFLAWWALRAAGRDALADREAVHDAVGFAIEVAGLTCGRVGADPPRRVEVAWPGR